MAWRIFDRRGITLLIAGAALVGLGILFRDVLGDRLWWWTHRGPEYWGAFESVAGLQRNDGVRYGGLEVGRVKEVRIDSADPGRLIVVFRVQRGTPIVAGTVASVVDVTWAVTRYLSLKPGAPRARPLPPGSEVTTQPGATLEDIATRLAFALDRADTLLVAAVEVTKGGTLANLANATARLDTLLGLATRTAVRTRPAVEASIRSLSGVLAHTDSLLAVVDSARPDLREAPAAAVSTLQETRDVLAQMRVALEATGGLAPLLRDLRRVSDRFARLAGQLERNPAALLGRRATPPKTAGPSIRD